MFSSRDLLVAVAAGAVSTAVLAQSTTLPGIGRPATPKEVAAWDIDVRPDFKGLPKGAGSVAKGQDVWEGKCASCHGVFGESGEVFNPLVGGTTKADIATGRVARLTDSGYPGRTTLMKVAHVSTLWDYINRAMPWNQPKSLSTEEVYAVTAYLLNMGDIVPGDFVLSDRNIADVQQRLPNRNGLTTRHGLWPGEEFGSKGKPDVQGSACMNNCSGEPKLASSLPDFARDAHGNLAEQNRAVGAQRGADTSRPPGAAKAATVVAAASPPAGPAKPVPGAVDGKAAIELTQKYACTACHGNDKKIVGPGFREIASKYAGRPDGAGYLAGKIKAGGSGVWGPVPMPAQTLPEADARAIADWLAAGAPK
jgi:cytochrome c